MYYNASSCLFMIMVKYTSVVWIIENNDNINLARLLWKLFMQKDKIMR